MELKTTESVFILQFDPLFTLAIASIAILLGVHIRKKSRTLDNFCVPIALIGGVYIVLARIALYYFYNTAVVFDTSILPYFFLAFFVAIGLNASIALISHGGTVLFYCIAACWGMIIIQNLVGIGMAFLCGIHSTLGVIAGSASLAGGHGSALAFGSLIEANGIIGAEAAGLACATFGVLAGSSFGPPLAKFLINRHNLKIETSHDPIYTQHHEDAKSLSINPTNFLKMFTIVLSCMALGSWIGDRFNELIKNSAITLLGSLRFPDYVWAMLLASFVRNVGDITNLFKRCAGSLGLIMNLSLRYAVVCVVMTLKVTELQNIALPLLIILSTQTALVLLMVIFFFPLLGKDYDAAVICAGLCGLMLGAPHSAISNISSVCEKHDKVYSYKAFLVISICGAALIDIFMMPFTSICISLLW